MEDPAQSRAVRAHALRGKDPPATHRPAHRRNRSCASLPHQGLDLMLDIARIAPVDKAVGEATHQPEAPVDLSQQQGACVPARRLDNNC